MPGNFLDAALNSFTQTTASYVQPAIGGTVLVRVASTSWIPLGLSVFLETGGTYEVTQIIDAQRVVLQRAASGVGASTGATVPLGVRFSAAGSPGADGEPGKGIASVRAVQTAPLTGWVYDNAAGTWTAPAEGALPSPWPAFDSVSSPATSDAGYEINDDTGVTGGTTGARKGIAVLTSVGSGGSKAALTRRADLSTSADFVGGVAYDVLDGTSAAFKGTRRQLYTQGTIVLGTTPLTFGAVRADDQKEINLATDPRYLAQFRPTATYEIADQLQAAVDDLQRSGTAGTIRLPMGAAYNSKPIRLRRVSAVKIYGAGAGKTKLIGAHTKGGANFWYCDPDVPCQFATTPINSLCRGVRMWVTMPTTTLTVSFVQPSVGSNRQISVGNSGLLTTGFLVPGDTFRIEGGGYYQLVSVDSGALITVKNTGHPDNVAPAVTVPASASNVVSIPSIYNDTILNLSYAGHVYDLAPLIDNAISFRYDVASGGHIYSRYGKLLNGDALSVCEQMLQDSSGNIDMQLRVWSASSVVGHGASPPAVGVTTLGRTVFLKIQCTAGGTGTTAKFKVSSCEGNSWSEGREAADVDGEGVEITMAPTVTLTKGRLAGVVLSFAAGTYTTGHSWTNYETLRCTQTGGMTASTSAEYMTRWTFDQTSKQLKLYVATVGSSYPTAIASAASGLANPVVNEQCFEVAIFGRGQSATTNSSKITASAIGFCTGAINPFVNPVRGFCQDLISGTGTLQAYTRFHDVDDNTTTVPLIGRDDGVVWGWKLNALQGYLLFERVGSSFAVGHEVAALTIDNTGTNRSGLIVTSAPHTHLTWSDIVVLGGCFGFVHAGTGFENRWEGRLFAQCTKFDVYVYNCASPAHCQLVTYGDGVQQFFLNASLSQDAEHLLYAGTGHAGLVTTTCLGGEMTISIDDEGGGGYNYAPFACSMVSAARLKVNGSMSLVNTTGCSPVMTDSSVGYSVTGTLVLNCTVGANAGVKSIVCFRDANVRPVLRDSCYSNTFPTIPFSNKPALTIAHGGRLAPVIATDANRTLAAVVPISSLQVPAGTLSTARTYVLTTTDTEEGWEWRMHWLGAQTGNLVIKDDAGNTIDTVLAATLRSTFIYRRDGGAFKVLA